MQYTSILPVGKWEERGGGGKIWGGARGGGGGQTLRASKEGVGGSGEPSHLGKGDGGAGYGMELYKPTCFE